MTDNKTPQETNPETKEVEVKIEVIDKKEEGSEEGQTQPEVKEEEKQVENKTEEAEVEPEVKSLKRITKAELVAELNDLQEDYDVVSSKVAEKDSEIASLKAELDKVQKEIQSYKETSDKFTGIIQEVIQEKKNSVPESIQQLLPDGLSVEQQLEWLNKAQQTGQSLKKETPQIEIGKPMGMGVAQTDTTNMTPHQKLSSYFATVFNK